jgi:hypothetical protein
MPPNRNATWKYISFRRAEGSAAVGLVKKAILVSIGLEPRRAGRGINVAVVVGGSIVIPHLRRAYACDTMPFRVVAAEIHPKLTTLANSHGVILDDKV